MKQNYIRLSQQDRIVLPSAQQSLEIGGDIRGGFRKRAFDVALATVAIVLLSPLLIGVALAIRLSDGGPALFGQTRIGANGKPFRIWKFRSMVPDAAERLREHLDRDPQARREWQATRKLKCDPRITPLGRVIRKYSVDELPQLFNILLGDMSFVGPRPIEEAECVRYRRSLRHYLKCRPGLTGLWQVSGRSDTSYERRVVLDRYYATHSTLKLDMALILKTVPVALTGQGSY
ncbi:MULTISPECIES: sugar transferase [Tabrizicola]|uniref:sugar transferase n=1 Tax=Tabrizicola TaxID=1443919 RepID=UPI001081BCDC|nr:MULTISPECIES: sugar transferase [Paracoccaceae]